MQYWPCILIAFLFLFLHSNMQLVFSFFHHSIKLPGVSLHRDHPELQVHASDHQNWCLPLPLHHNLLTTPKFLFQMHATNLVDSVLPIPLLENTDYILWKQYFEFYLFHPLIIILMMRFLNQHQYNTYDFLHKISLSWDL